MFVLALFGGVMADRLDKRKVICYTQSVLGVLAGILAYLVMTDQIRLWHIMLIALASGTTFALDAPLRQSFVKSVVGDEDLSAAIALNSAAFNTARLIGPAIAGQVIALWGQAFCFVLNAISYFAVVMALLLIRVRPEPRESAYTSVWSDLWGGLDYVRSRPTILALILMIAVPSTLAFPANTLLPIFARDILHQGVTGFSIMLSSAGAGALLGALVLPSGGKLFGRGKFMLSACALLGLSLIGLAFSRSFAVTLIFLAGVGFGTVVFAASTNSLVQLESSDEMRGRVMGAHVFMFLGLSPIGSLLLGSIAELASPTVAVAFGGTSALALALGIWVKRPDIRLL